MAQLKPLKWTREELAIVVAGVSFLVSPEPVEPLVAAAAELRKSCATCRYFGVRSLAETGDPAVEAHWCHESPREVSGGDFCSRWAQ